jgi:hypothetical protein
LIRETSENESLNNGPREGNEKCLKSGGYNRAMLRRILLNPLWSQDHSGFTGFQGVAVRLETRAREITSMASLRV